MKHLYLILLLALTMSLLGAIQIGLKGERYAMDGMEYYYRGDYAKAIEQFKAADNSANGSVPYYHFWMGRLYIAVQDTSNAVGWLQSYIASGDQEFVKETNDYLDIINNQTKVFEKVSLRAMPSYLNSRNSDYGAIVDPEGKYLYFTSLRPAKFEKENIWRAELFKSGYGRPELVSELATDGNEAFGSFVPDGNGAWVFGNYEKGKLDGDIYYVPYSGKFGKPQPVPGINSNALDAHPCVVADSLMFFTSAREGGFGGTDIWVSEKREGVWNEPINLGPRVNTPDNEQTPQLMVISQNIVHEGKYVPYEEIALFFSSNGHPGFGGYDLFKVIHKGPSWQDWYLPQNLGLPVNSIRNDRYFNIRPGTNEVFISSDRAASGFEKVFLAYADFTIPGYKVDEDSTGTKVYDIIVPPDTVTDTDVVATGDDDQVIIPIPEEKFITFTGQVTDEDGNPIQTEIVFTATVDGKKFSDTVTTDPDGRFRIRLPWADPWTVVINPEGYMLYTQDIPAPADGEDAEEINFVIQKMEVRKVFVFNNIQFDFDKDTLRKESYPILDDIVITMLNNAWVKIEISGHTCNIGKEDYNQDLSQRRAKAVVDYLIGKGVERERLTWKGYGESKPLNGNQTPAERALNRRVEVKVME